MGFADLNESLPVVVIFRWPRKTVPSPEPAGTAKVRGNHPRQPHCGLGCGWKNLNTTVPRKPLLSPGDTSMAITYESLRNFVRKSGVEVRVYAPEAEVIFLKDGTQDTIS